MVTSFFLKQVTPDEVTEYCKTFQNKLTHLIEPQAELSTEEVTKLGMKNADAEVEKFISANTQELGPQKWLCPLSGKKFKGPEFVLKHIQNKHGEKIDEVRLEVSTESLNSRLFSFCFHFRFLDLLYTPCRIFK